jgi:hypothetical protein
MRSPCCLCVYESILLTFECLNIMAPGKISNMYSINPSNQSCVRMCIPPFIARQPLSEHVTAATNTRNNRRIVGRMCLWVCQCISLLLLSNYSVETFPLQQRIVGAIVSYAVRVSKESRQLVLPRTSVFHLSVPLFSVIQSFDAMRSELLRESLNIRRINK